MFDVTCLDTYGEVITHLTQWDIDQSLIIKNTGLSSSPVFHFYNQNSKEAYVVSSTLENDVITVHIPNVLLQEGIPIVACLYAYSSLTSGKTLATVKIPVRPRPKPSEYKYVENIDVVSVVQLKKDIADEIASLEDLKVELNQDISTIKSEFSNIKEEFEGYKPLIDAKIPIAEKGAANGVAELDTSGKVPASQLPSYVDDVIEGTYATFPEVGETGKIYLDTETNLAWRWSGTRYAQIAASLALGETSSTAYAGNKGKKNADDIAALTTRVTDNEENIDNINEDILYSNNTPTPKDIGGITKGSTFENMGLKEILENLLYPYVAPVIKSTSLTNYVEMGNGSKVVGAFTVSIAKGSKDITSAELKISDNTPNTRDILNSIIGVNNLPCGDTYSVAFNIQNIQLSETNNTTIELTISDGTDTYSKVLVTFSHIYAKYVGVADSIESLETSLTSSTKSITPKGAFTYFYNAANQIPFFAYPVSYGKLSKIQDANGFDVTNTFGTKTVSVTNSYNKTIDYYVYYLLNPTTISNFKFTFTY